MNTHKALEEAVFQNPKEDSAAAALIDFELEFMNCNRGEAELHVEILRVAAHQASELVEATNLLASGTRSVHAFKNFIARSIQAYYSAAGWTIVLVAGANPPCAHRAPPQPVFNGNWGTITVGASWVMREWGLRVSRQRAAGRARYARRRHVS